MPQQRSRFKVIPVVQVIQITQGLLVGKLCTVIFRATLTSAIIGNYKKALFGQLFGCYYFKVNHASPRATMQEYNGLVGRVAKSFDVKRLRISTYRTK